LHLFERYQQFTSELCFFLTATNRISCGFCCFWSGPKTSKSPLLLVGALQQEGLEDCFLLKPKSILCVTASFWARPKRSNARNLVVERPQHSTTSIGSFRPVGDIRKHSVCLRLLLKRAKNILVGNACF
jgi:hypothetical protein